MRANHRPRLHNRITSFVWGLGLAALSAGVGGCPGASDTPAGSTNTTNNNGSQTTTMDWYPLGGTPQYTSGSVSGSQKPGTTSAACALTYDQVPQGVPSQSMYEPEETIAQLGGVLNQFWQVNACVFRIDPTVYPTCANNAVSFSYPNVILYDPGFFNGLDQRFSTNVGSKLFAAHEWGHQVQFVHGVLGSSPTTAEMEGDADRRAGYFLGWIAQQDGSANVADLADLLGQIACSAGGSDVPTYFDPYAHGSCDTRMRNVVTGFDQAVRASPVGRQARANPAAPAGQRGLWRGPTTVTITVIDEQEHTVAVKQRVTFDYGVEIGADGKVLNEIVDNQSYGPLPDVGEERTTPIQGNEMDFGIISNTVEFSFDDDAARYASDLRVETGDISGIAVTGTGYETAVYALLPDGTLNVYVYDSLTLGAENGNQATIVLETKGILEPDTTAGD